MATSKTEPHLDLLRKMKARIQDAVFDPDCPPRDLASLTRRLQDISREINELEERAKREGKSNGRAGTAKAKADWNPTEV